MCQDHDQHHHHHYHHHRHHYHHHHRQYTVGSKKELLIKYLAISFDAMTAKRLNIICCKEQDIRQYFPGTKTDALIHEVMGRFQLDHSNFYLKVSPPSP